MFNSLRYAKKLEAVGVPREHAEVQVQILAEVLEGELVTKEDMRKTNEDIRGLRTEMVQMEYRLTIKLGTIMTLGLAALATIMTILTKVH